MDRGRLMSVQTVRHRVRRVFGLLEIPAVLLLITALVSSGLTGWQFWMLLAGIVLVSVSVIFRLRGTAGAGFADAERLEQLASLAEERNRLQVQVDQFETLREQVLQQFTDRDLRLTERERDLVQRCARVQELLDYPTDDVHQGRESADLVRLSEQDNAVRLLLESEAERVYEKIRANGYSKDGNLNVVLIRDEAHELIRRIARIYSPDSKQPLMETSFEQLARAASRICLHVLVLLEQLPLNVQQYNFNSLYGYFRKAVVGYGAFQKAAPWFKGLSRGVYAGRMLSMTNPLSMGAWWLASELGRKGTQKLVENVIDRQAVSILHDLVTVIGVEVACIYGTGFRQRDPAWVLGTELVELVSQFPLSRESLRAGLQAVTSLPLRNEYDRIYLYRCLANHRSAGHQLADSAMLTRAEREAIASQLEQFFGAHIHGVTAEKSSKWRSAAEERLDLRLQLTEAGRTATVSHAHAADEAAVSVAVFLRSIAGASTDEIIRFLPQSRTWQFVAEPNRTALLDQFRSLSADQRFTPPGLEPTSPVTDAFLCDLACVTVRFCADEPHIEKLVVETGGYFRRTLAESQRTIDAQWLAEFRRHCVDSEIHPELNGPTVQRILKQREGESRIAFAYPEVSLRFGNDETRALTDAWLVGFIETTPRQRRLIVSWTDESNAVPWSHAGALAVQRERGLLIDSAAIGGGQLHGTAAAILGIPPAQSATLLVSGSLRGGRFRNYFRPLLAFAESAIPEHRAGE